MIILDRQTFMRCAEDADMEAREDYSGRGMYGRTCPAVVGRVNDVAKFYVFLAIEGEEMIDTTLELADMQSTDSMGYDNVFYWSGLTLED